ncbi:MAG: hypothetical protein CL910_12415 [Deltaproteobacteria bacterium]|jgi:hypothetical protein|nr:hypothetical protein [Deltaproteobacteria bacterium]
MLRPLVLAILGLSLLGATPSREKPSQRDEQPELDVPRARKSQRKGSSEDRRKPRDNREIGPAIGAALPHIEQVVPFSKCAPGERIAFTGRNFGEIPGRVDLLGDFAGGKLKLEIMDWPKSGLVSVRVPEVGGVKDHPVQLRLTNAGGAAGNRVPCDFKAARERVWLPLDSTHMRLSLCHVGDDYGPGNLFEDPDTTHDQTSGSLRICGHTSDGDNIGIDKHETRKLMNGWRFVEWSFAENSAQGGHVLMRTGFVQDATQLALRVHWQIDGGGTAHYSFRLGIEGPRGVPFR